MKIDFKKILKKFGENYDFIYDAERNNIEVVGYYDALNYFDDMMDNNTSFVDFIRKLVDIRGDFFSSDREIVALMFALEDLKLLDAIESGKIEESKKAIKNKDITEGMYFDADSNVGAVNEFKAWSSGKLKKSLKESKIVTQYKGNNPHKHWYDGDERFIKEDSKYIYVEKFVQDQFGSGWTDVYKIDKKDVIKAEVDKDGYLHYWTKSARDYMKNSPEFDFGFEGNDVFESLEEDIQKSTWGKWVVDKVYNVYGFFNGEEVNGKVIDNLLNKLGIDTDFDTVKNEIIRGIKSYKLGDLDYWAIHIGHGANGNRFDIHGRVAFSSELTQLIDKDGTVTVYFDVQEQGEDEWNFGFIADVGVKVRPVIDTNLVESLKDEYGFGCAYESKKSARKSITEMFGEEELVGDFVDFLIYECEYDKKTVEKYFYKKYKLNDFDTLSIKDYVKIKNEIEHELGYDNII